ncbi:MAG: cytochrome P460 family protein [Roseibium sp.]|nr:cytochrome P460 family protein [Roseibium sp.]
MQRVIVLLCIGLVAYSARADTALQTIERYGVPLVAYAQVDRSDGTSRRMLTTRQTIDQAAAGEALPDGTRILMETYYRPGDLSTVFHMQKVDGRWQYGSFNGLGTPNLETRPQASCLSCHAQAADTGLVFTRPALDAARAFGKSRFTCDRGGRSPCALQVYLEGAER